MSDKYESSERLKVHKELSEYIDNMSIAELNLLIDCRRKNDWEFIEHILFKNSYFNNHYIFDKLENRILSLDNEYILLQQRKIELDNEIFKLKQKLIWKQN